MTQQTYFDNIEFYNTSRANGETITLQDTGFDTVTAAANASGATIQLKNTLLDDIAGASAVASGETTSIIGSTTLELVSATASATGDTIDLAGSATMSTVSAEAHGLGGDDLALRNVIVPETATAEATGGEIEFDILGRNDEVNVYIDGTRIDSYQEMEIEERLNEPDTFSFTAFIVDDSQRGLISQGNDIIITENYDLLFKGRLEEVNYNTSFQAECQGEGMETKLLDRKTGREEYINTPADDIVRDITPTDTVTLGTIEDAPTTSIRFDHDNKARGVAGVANAVGYDWEIRNEFDDNFETDYLDFVERLGSETPVKTFSIGEDAQMVDDGGDDSFVANDITLLGRGDGINQLEARVYAAAEEFTQLTADLAETGTTINVSDTTVLGTVGDNIIAKIGVELIDADIVDSTTLSVNSRGVTNFENEETKQILHRENVSVWLYENVTQGLGPFTPENQDSAQTGSSIASKGVKQLRETDKTIIKLPTLEVIADRELRNRYMDVKQIEVRPTDPRIAGDVSLGDTITIDAGLGADLLGDYRVVGMDHKRRSSGEGTVLHCANRPRRLVERLSEIDRDKDTLNAHMQGATNIDTQSFTDNCDSDNPLKTQLYVPEDAVAVNKVEITFAREKFRGYVQNEAHQHGVEDTLPSAETGEYINPNSLVVNRGDSVSSPFITQERPSSPTGSEADTLVNFGIHNYSSVGKNYDWVLENQTTGAQLDSGSVSLASNSTINYNRSYADNEVANDDIVAFQLAASSDTLESDGPVLSKMFLDMSVTSEHDHTIDSTTTAAGDPVYGIFEQNESNTIDVDVVVDGTVVQTITGVSPGQTVDDVVRLEEDLTEPIAGEWHDLELVPSDQTRLTANVFKKVFIESSL